MCLHGVSILCTMSYTLSNKNELHANIMHRQVLTIILTRNYSAAHVVNEINFLPMYVPSPKVYTQFDVVPNSYPLAQ